jgi:hypothetical protein
MKKLLYPLAMLLIVGLSNCGSEAPEETTTDESPQEEQPVDTAQTEAFPEQETEIFNLHPEVQFEPISPDMAVKYATIHFYEGQVNNETIYFIFKQGLYSNTYFNGLLYQPDQGKAYQLNGSIIDWDSISASFYLNDTLQGSLTAKLADYRSSFSGELILAGDTTVLNLAEIETSPEHRQLFIELDDPDYANTADDGLVYMGYEDEEFGGLFTSSESGFASDFGEEWWAYETNLHVYENDLIYVQSMISNATGTEFEPGHEPTGMDDQDYVVAGETYSCTFQINYSYLQDSILTEDETNLEFDFNVSNWFLQDKIILMKTSNTESGYTELYQVYQWNPTTHSFDLL